MNEESGRERKKKREKERDTGRKDGKKQGGREDWEIKKERNLMHKTMGLISFQPGYLYSTIIGISLRKIKIFP